MTIAGDVSVLLAGDGLTCPVEDETIHTDRDDERPGMSRQSGWHNVHPRKSIGI